MMKFLLIMLLAWFVINRLLRFKVIIYKDGQSGRSFNGPFSTSAKREGTLRVDKEPTNPSNTRKGPKEGDYVDYEEV